MARSTRYADHRNPAADGGGCDRKERDMKVAEYTRICRSIAERAAETMFEGRTGHGGGECTYRQMNQATLVEVLRVASKAAVDESLRYERGVEQDRIVSVLREADAAIEALELYEDIDTTPDEFCEGFARRADRLRTFRRHRDEVIERAKEKRLQVSSSQKRYHYESDEPEDPDARVEVKKAVGGFPHEGDPTHAGLVGWWWRTEADPVWHGPFPDAESCVVAGRLRS